MKKNITKILIAVMVILSVSFTTSAENNSCSHQWGKWNIKKSATISRQGSKTHKCIKCGQTQTKAIAKLKPYVKFSKKKIEIKKSNKKILKVNFAKGDSIKQWKSNKPKLVTVTKNGKITAKNIGTAKITVTMKSGKKASCTVKVIAKKKPSNQVSSNNGIVYWVTNGTVYHSTRECPSLKRSKVINSGSASDCPKSRPCKLCH